MASLEKQPYQEPEQQGPAEQAGIFLKGERAISKPPEDFAPGFVNLGAFQLFTEDRRLDVEGYQDAIYHISRYPGEDVRPWVTPDYSHIYVFVRTGSETKIAKQKRNDATRPVGQLALSKSTT